MRHKGKATIVRHCAVRGRSETSVREVWTADPARRLEFYISFYMLRKRIATFFSIRKDKMTYFTVEVDGRVIWDSRYEVPCAMEKWQATNASFQDNRPFKHTMTSSSPRPGGNNLEPTP
jgi:hypothetical protein